MIDSFLTDNVGEDGQRLNGRELFSNALRQMNAAEGSEAIENFLASLEQMGSQFKPDSGVTQEFLDSLERVDISRLPESADCPICTNRFVDNEYPLVVKLPCHVQGSTKKEHIFDMDCIAPWLKMNATCPLCRFNVLDVDKLRREKLEEELRKAKEEEDEEEEDDWDVYG